MLVRRRDRGSREHPSQPGDAQSPCWSLFSTAPSRIATHDPGRHALYLHRLLSRVVLLTGRRGRFLFTPLSASPVVFAMIASYLLSRTARHSPLAAIWLPEDHEESRSDGLWGRFLDG